MNKSELFRVQLGMKRAWTIVTELKMKAIGDIVARGIPMGAN